jgi:hypothetical protein
MATEFQPDLEHPYVRCRPEPAIVGLMPWLL